MIKVIISITCLIMRAGWHRKIEWQYTEIGSPWFNVAITAINSVTANKIH